MTPFWRRKRDAHRRRTRWFEHPEDPENDDRQREARAKMRFFDRLGPAARAAAQGSRFDALDVDRMRRQYGCGTDFSDPPIDQRVANDVQREDDCYSGMFGPPARVGI